MALIKCPECGRKISDTCDVCIHCGYKLNKKINNIFNTPPTLLNPNLASPNVNVEKIVAHRKKASASLGVFLLGLGIIAIIFFIIWICNGFSKSPGFIQGICVSVLCFGLMFIFLSIPLLSTASQNNKLPDVCISYNTYSRHLKLHCLNGEVLEININDFVEIKNNLTSSLHVVYKNEAGTHYTVKLGYSEDKFNIQQNIDHYKNAKN